MASFKRDAYHQLNNWKQQKARKPLIIQGARQVGKTHLLQEFANREYARHIYINFEQHESVKAFFENDLNPKQILKNLELHFDEAIDSETLLIFDEIQECENALTSLKYFCKETPEQAITCAGSLLGVKVKRLKGFPVGYTTFLDLYPFTFPEFLNAIGKDRLHEYILGLHANETITPAIHNQLIDLLKIYFIVGGMPGIIQQYLDTDNFELVRNAQNDILNSYHLDFVKHTTASNAMKITDTWKSIPKQLAKDNKKFQYSVIQKNARAREYRESLEWLINSGLILPTYQLEKKPKLPLSAYANRDSFKVYSLDTGLLGAQAGLSPKLLIDGDKLFAEFKGALTENYVAQEITALFDKHLFYWSQDNTAEVDFVLQNENNIIPLEVKSGNNIKAKSLKKYRDLYKPKLALKTSPLNLKKQDGMINVPLYLVGIIRRLIESSIG